MTDQPQPAGGGRGPVGAITFEQWNVLQPVGDHGIGPALDSGLTAIPPQLTNAALRADCPATGVTQPFNNPAQELTLDVYASYDNGLSVQQIYSQTANGSPTGIWGKGSTWPQWGLGVPHTQTGIRATHFQAILRVTRVPAAGDVISFGLSLLPSAL